MTPDRAWLAFDRQGGREPRDDESLEIAEDGAFTARRTLGGGSIGSFEGRLSSASLRGLRTAVTTLADAADLAIATPDHGATETLVVLGRTLECGSNETPPKPWRSVLTRVRRILTEEVIDHPAAAIRLVATAGAAGLEHAGSLPIEVDLGSAEVRVTLKDDDDVVHDRWTARVNGRIETAKPGWRVDLPFDHGLAVKGDRWLQVRVMVAIREGGRRRAGRLYVPVLADA